MDEPTTHQVGYLELIRRNRNLRRIWLGDVASLLGDWFNTIALYTLVERLTGSPLALSGVFVTKMLSFALASPLGGLLADRVDRRRLMIACDLLRSVLVLGFLLVDEPSEIPLLYTLTALQLAIGAPFHPARNASIPNVTSPRELLTANALMAATWSSLLALGAALGGVAPPGWACKRYSSSTAPPIWCRPSCCSAPRSRRRPRPSTARRAPERCCGRPPAGS